MEEDGRRWKKIEEDERRRKKMEENKVETKTFKNCKDVGDVLGTLVGVPIAPQKNPTWLRPKIVFKNKFKSI